MVKSLKYPILKVTVSSHNQQLWVNNQQSRVNNQQSWINNQLSRVNLPTLTSTVNKPIRTTFFWFCMIGLPTPPLPPSLVSKLDRRHTGRLKKRDNGLTGAGGRDRMRGRSHILALYKPYKPLNILCFILHLISVLFWPLWRAVASIHERDLTTALFSRFFSSCNRGSVISTVMAAVGARLHPSTRGTSPRRSSVSSSVPAQRLSYQHSSGRCGAWLHPSTRGTSPRRSSAASSVPAPHY